MKLAFCYFENLENLGKDVEVTLNSKYKYTTNKDGDYLIIELEENTDYISKFFYSDNINENCQLDIVGIIGENGVGKTTILNAINSVDFFEDKGYLFIYIKEYENDENDELFVVNNLYSELIFEPDVKNSEPDIYSIGEHRVAYFIDESKTGREVNIFIDFLERYSYGLSEKIEKQEAFRKINDLFLDFKHINELIYDNYLILFARMNTNSFELIDYRKARIVNNEEIYIKPFTLAEINQGDFKNNKRIENIEDDISDLREREVIYVLVGLVKEQLKDTRCEVSIDILGQIIVDYIRIKNIKSIKTIKEGIEQFKKQLDDLSDIENKDFFDIGEDTEIEVFNDMVKSIIKLYLELIRVGHKDNNGFYTVNYTSDIAKTIIHKPYILKYFKLVNKNINDEEIKVLPFSAGETEFIKTLSNIIMATHKDNGDEFFWQDNVLILLDEPDIALHPNWQRIFWKQVIEAINKHSKKNVQILFTTHSPLMISDIPRYNLNILTNGKQENDMNTQTFGANIYDLYKKNFFLDKPIGEFALTKINEFYMFYTDIIKENNEEYLKEQRSYINKSIHKYQQLINIVGEPLIKNDMQAKLNELNKQINGESIKKEILEHEIFTLKQKLSDLEKQHRNL